jgi:hypothetical protein
MKQLLDSKYYNDITELCKIMSKHGSDKGIGYHNYTTLYHNLFAPFKDTKINILEVGLGTNNVNVPSNMGANGIPGASLRGWEEYFSHPESIVVGLDIDKNVLFQTNKIKTFYCDQTDPNSIENVWNLIPNITEFDIILDDGLHTYEAGITFLENSIHKLKKEGIYIIEDLLPVSQALFATRIQELKEKYSLTFIDIVSIPHTNKIDNCILLIVK